MIQPEKQFSWILQFEKRFGLIPTVMLIIGMVIPASVLMSIVIGWMWNSAPTAKGICTSILIPVFVGAPLAYFILNILFKLEEMRIELYEISMRDELTGSYNRRYFLQQLQHQLNSAVRYKIPFSAIMFDVDDFKKINDTYGHSTGDQLLRLLSQTCMKESRVSDIFARLGGDEFVFIAPGLNAQQVFRFAQRIQQAAVNVCVPVGKQEVHFTISLGCFTWTDQVTETDSLLKQLDLAMYAAKNRGKNRVVHALDLMGGQVFPGIFEPGNVEPSYNSSLK